MGVVVGVFEVKNLKVMVLLMGRLIFCLFKFFFKVKKELVLKLYVYEDG